MGLESLLKACFRSEKDGLGASLGALPGKEQAAGTKPTPAAVAPAYASTDWTAIEGGKDCRNTTEPHAPNLNVDAPGAASSGRLAAQALKPLGGAALSADSQLDASVARSSAAATTPTAAAAAAPTVSQRCDASTLQCFTQDGDSDSGHATGRPPAVPSLATGGLDGGPLPHQYHQLHHGQLNHDGRSLPQQPLHQHQQQQQHQRQMFVADLTGFSCAVAAADGGVCGVGVSGGGCATTTGITPLTSSALQSALATTTGAASTREASHVSRSSQMLSEGHSLPSAPLPPPPRTLLYSPPHVQEPLGPLSRPRTAPQGNADSGGSSLPLHLPPPPGSGGGATAAPAAPSERGVSAPLLPPHGSGRSIGTGDLPWALCPGPGSTGPGDRSTTGTGTVARTLSDMPGLDLNPASPLITAALSDNGSSAFHVPQVFAAAAATAAGSGGDGGVTAAAAAERRELGLIRVSSLSELSGQLEGLRWLASGSSGRVFTGLWKGSPVAVKVVLSTTQDQLRDSSREALLSRVVSHPAICQCYTVCSECLTADHLQLPRLMPALAWVRRSASSSFQGDVLGFPAAPSLPHTPPASTVPDSYGGMDGLSGFPGGDGPSHHALLATFGGPSAAGVGSAAVDSAAAAAAAATAAACGGATPTTGESPLLFVRESFGMATAAAVASSLAVSPGRRVSQSGTPPGLSPRLGTALPGSRCGSTSSVSSRGAAAALASALPARCASSGGGSASSSSQGRMRVLRQHRTQLQYGAGAAALLPSAPTAQPPPQERAAAAAQDQGAARRADGYAAADTTAAAAAAATPGAISADNSLRGSAAAASIVSTLFALGSGPASGHVAACGPHSPAAAVAATTSPGSAAVAREARRCLAPSAVAAAAAAAAAAAELNTTLSLSELLRSYTPADEDTNSAMQSLPAVLLSMGAVPGRYCTIVVLEWCNQGTLLQAIRNRPFNPERSPDNHGGLLALLRTALEIAQGMRYLHALDIVHGDLKPSNVLLQSHAVSLISSLIWAADMRGYVAKVADFGLAMPAHHSSVGGVVGGSGGIIGIGGGHGGGGGEAHWGALAYLAPEVPEYGSSKKSDVYSYGCVLYHMCTGKQPFQGIRQGRLLVGLATGSLVLQWPDHIYKVLRKLGEACCAPNPRDRPSFDRIVDALQKTIAYVARSPSPSGSSRTGHEQIGSSTTSTEAEAAEAAAAAAAWRSAVVGFTTRAAAAAPPPPPPPARGSSAGG